MIEREKQKRRAVELRAGGRSGVRIAARMGVALRTLRRWTDQDDAFRVAYDGVYRLWKSGDDKGLKILLAGYRPERAAGTGRKYQGTAELRVNNLEEESAIPEATES